MTQELAEAIALQALSHIVAESTLCSRFLELTGIVPDDLRARIDDISVLGAVLDFLLSDEPSLMDFCAAADIAPQLPARARLVLMGDTASEWG